MIIRVCTCGYIYIFHLFCHYPYAYYKVYVMYVIYACALCEWEEYKTGKWREEGWGTSRDPSSRTEDRSKSLPFRERTFWSQNALSNAALEWINRKWSIGWRLQRLSTPLMLPISTRNSYWSKCSCIQMRERWISLCYVLIGNVNTRLCNSSVIRCPIVGKNRGKKNTQYWTIS